MSTPQLTTRLPSTMLTLVVLMFALVLPACTNEKDEQAIEAEAEQLKKAIEDTGEQLKDSVESAGGQLRDALEDTGEQLREAVETNGGQLREQIEDTGEQLKNALGKDTMDSIVGYTGTIVFKDLEGGFYAFDGEDGTKLMLLNLDANYQQNGLVVEVKGIPAPDIMTTAQYGTPFTISEIRIIDDSKVNQTPQNPTQ